MQNRLILIFEHLAGHFGPLHWWPAESPFEMAVGAILTQNTAWTNVEKAIDRLRQEHLLSVKAIVSLPPQRLEEMIRPAGFFRQKAHRLQLFAAHLLALYGGSLETMLDADLEEVRAELLGLKGIGPETADSILLYAGDHPSFVIDAYTRRLFSRLGLLGGDETYNTIRRLFMDRLPPEADLFNEYHALIVEECKRYCRKRRPLCPACPLESICPSATLPT